jgi:hypothetical protein
MLLEVAETPKSFPPMDWRCVEACSISALTEWAPGTPRSHCGCLPRLGVKSCDRGGGHSPG